MFRIQTSIAKKTLLVTCGAILVAATGLVGCSKNSSPPAQVDNKPSETMEEKEKLNGVIPQSQLDALKKAKGVEDTLKEAEEKRQKELNSL